MALRMSQHLTLKHRAGDADGHVQAQRQAFAHRQGTVFTRNHQRADFFAEVRLNGIMAWRVWQTS